MNFQTEPSALVGAIGTAVAAVLTLLVAFGVDLSQTQITAILGAVATLGPVVVGLVVRSKVYSPATHEVEVEYAALNARGFGGPADVSC